MKQILTADIEPITYTFPTGVNTVTILYDADIAEIVFSDGSTIATSGNILPAGMKMEWNYNCMPVAITLDITGTIEIDFN